MATILDFGKATDEVLRVHGISATVRVNEGGGAVGVLVCNSDGVMPAKGSDLKDATILVLLQDYDEAGVAAFRSIGLVNSGDGKRHCWEVPREGGAPMRTDQELLVACAAWVALVLESRDCEVDHELLIIEMSDASKAWAARAERRTRVGLPRVQPSLVSSRTERQ